MGRIRYILFHVSKMLPKQHRRPIILISSLLGLIVFYNVLYSLTRSSYLMILKSGFLELISPLNDTRQIVIVILLFFLVLGWSSWKYYKYIQTAINMGYVILLILAILPYCIGL